MRNWIVVFLTTGAAALLLLTVAVAARRSGQTKSTVVATEGEIKNKEATALPAGDQRPTPVLIELFTSEGCSSCPPADEVLANFEQRQPFPGVEIIALGQHVDYWNRLGWTDPFSAAAFSERQGEYADAFSRDGVYTPQMIVDGQAEFPGGNQAKARTAITNAAKSPKAEITVSRSPASSGSSAVTLQVSVEKLPAITAGDEAEVMLALTESDLSTSVPRGENAGRRLRHASVVRQLVPIGSAQAGTSFAARPTLTLNRDWRRKNLRAVIFIQERESRRVLGAASIKLAD
ncbi:MAG: DUF1223 domain-containing protein [Acidobacteriota bacterium]|nr:DUF1223 domain-containing protein [Acidobacteriota bacterium]